MATIDLTLFSPEYLAADRSQTLIDVAIVFMVLDTFFISLFFFSRYKCHIALSYDGWLMAPGYLLCLGHCIGDILLVKFGHAGRHVVTANKAQITWWLKHAVVEGYIYFPSTSFPKLAFLCLYLKIFTTKPYRYMTYATIGVIVLSNVALIIFSAVNCANFAYEWEKTNTSGNCKDLIAIYRWASMPNLVTDLVTILLPLPVVWRLHTTRAQKIGLTITFLTGCTGIVGCIFRFVLFLKTELLSDITWDSVPTMTWTTAEPSLYLIAACLPALRPLLKHYLQDVDLKAMGTKLLGSRSGSFGSKEMPSDVEHSSGSSGSHGAQGMKHEPADTLGERAISNPSKGGWRGFLCVGAGKDTVKMEAVRHPDVEKGMIRVRTDVYLQRHSR